MTNSYKEKKVKPQKLVSMSGKNRAINGTLHVLLTILSIVWLLPFVWLILHSFRGESTSYVNYIIPKEFTFDNYIRLFQGELTLNFGRMFLNTLIVSICSCIVSTVFVLMVSYAMSRLRFKSRLKLMSVSLILGMFPGFMSMIAIYFIFVNLGLQDANFSYLKLILAYSLGAGAGFFIMKGFFDTIPKSVDEAAMIDGATKSQVFTKIILPLSKPILVYTVLMAFIGPWADFVLAKVLLRDATEFYTVAIGLTTMLDRAYVSDYFTTFCAGAVIVAIPITIVFIALQRFYVEGVTGGAAKG